MPAVAVTTVVTSNGTSLANHLVVRVEATDLDVAEQPSIDVNVVARPRDEGHALASHQRGQQGSGLCEATFTAFGGVHADQSHAFAGGHLNSVAVNDIGN